MTTFLRGCSSSVDICSLLCFFTSSFSLSPLFSSSLLPLPPKHLFLSFLIFSTTIHSLSSFSLILFFPFSLISSILLVFFTTFFFLFPFSFLSLIPPSFLLFLNIFFLYFSFFPFPNPLFFSSSLIPVIFLPFLPFPAIILSFLPSSYYFSFLHLFFLQFFFPSPPSSCYFPFLPAFFLPQFFPSFHSSSPGILEDRVLSSQCNYFITLYTLC